MDVKKNLTHLQKDRFAYIREFFNRIEEIRCIQSGCSAFAVYGCAMINNRSDMPCQQQNISKSGIPFYVVEGSVVHLRLSCHTYRMSCLADTTIRTLFRLYLWTAQLLPDILVNTIEYWIYCIL
jgi:hypothetical protein